MTRLAVLALSTIAASAAQLQIERIFGPEIPTGRYKHPACITELANGDLYLVYYGGTGEYANDTGVFGSRLAKRTLRWSTPQRIAHDPFRSVGNGVVWQAPDGLVWLFYVVRWGETWSTSRIQAKVSRDNTETWSDSYVVTEREGMMVRNRPIVLENGDYLLPVYHETGHDTESVGPDSTSRFLVFNARSKQWTERGVIRSKKGNIQPGVVELDPGRLIAYCRRGGGYGPVTDGFIVRAESRDAGRTWSEGLDSQFPNPNSAIDFLKLRSGALLLVFNDSMTARTPLTAALPSDGDKTWQHRRNIAAQPSQSYAYPSALQTMDCAIHVVFTSDNRTVIQRAILDEDWIRQPR